MPTTGVLGSSFATLGSFTLGASPVLGDVVERTPGLVALWKCDDPPGSPFLAGINNLHDAVLAQGTVAYESVPGVDDHAVSTPVATKLAGDHEYDTARHLKFATAGGPINVGDAGTIELWFKPFEFADEVGPAGSPPGSDAGARGYEIFRLDSGGTGTRIRFMTGWPSQFGQFEKILRVNFTQPGYNGPDDGIWDGFANSGRDGTGFQSYSGFYPPCEAGRWYHLAFAWDQTGYSMYLNGVKIPNGNTGTAHPPPGLDGCDVSFGQSGGLYDLVSVTNRRMRDAEIKYRFDPGAATAPTTSEVYLTNYLVSYVAGYRSDTRVTSHHAEVLRTAERNARVTQARLEILRATGATPWYSRLAAQSLTFTETATGRVTNHQVISRTTTDTLTLTGTASETVVRPHVDTGTASQTLALTQTASGVVHVPIVRTASVTQSLGLTQKAVRVREGTAGHGLGLTQAATADVSHTASDTLAFTQTVTTQFERSRGVLQNLLMAQSEETAATHAVTLTDTLSVVETFSVGHVRSADRLHLLALAETVDAALNHTYSASASDTLDLTQEGDLHPAKFGAGRDTLLLVDTAQQRRVIVRSAGDTLAFTENVPRVPRVIFRGVADTLRFFDGFVPTTLPALIGGRVVELSVPVARVYKVTKTVVYRSASGAVVLPVPEFGDTDSGGSELDVKWTMTGKLYTYVQSSAARKLRYSFVLGRRKALELRHFVRANLSLLIHVTNWKGEEYAGQFTDNAVAFKTAGRYARGGERVEVELNFEGVRL